MKKTFMYMQKDLNIGGIETYIVRTVRTLKKEKHRIIWLAPKGGTIDDSFKKEMFDGYVEIISLDLDDFRWIDKLDIKFNKDEEVTAITFSLFHFVFLEMIKKKYIKTRIDDFFWVPHFKEKEVFLEEFAPSFIQPLLRKNIAKNMKYLEDNSNIFYVNQSHADAFMKRYGYDVKNKESKLLTDSTMEVPPYNEQLVLERSKRKCFNIITVGRFSFPHKAYILGLIKVYGELKELYGDLRLTIIGYGKDEDRVFNEVERLSPKAKKDLKIVGKVPCDELPDYFEKAHLNIGVAGAIADGAITGLISIPVRHYTEECEGYGYLPESRDYITSSEPGRPIKEYIEEVINMNQDMYLSLSQKAYKTFADSDITAATNRLLELKNTNHQSTLTNSFILSIRIAFKVAKFIRTLLSKA